MLINRMITKTLVGVTTGIWLTALLPHTAVSQEVASADVTEGARVYGAMCGRCHNPRSPLEQNDRSWAAIANHMRSRGNLTGKEVRLVLAFLQATNTDPRAQVRPAAAAQPQRQTQVESGPASTDPTVIAQGETLLQQKACVGCHVVGDAGGAVGPKLNGVVTRKGVEFVRRKLIDPTFNNSTSMMPNFGLTGSEVEAIVAFLGSLPND